MRKQLSILGVSLLLGCTELPEDDGIAEQQFGLESENLLSSNLLSSNLLSLNLLSSNSLQSASGQQTAEGMAATAGGRELLRYLVRCALPSGRTLSVTADGTTYTYLGSMGHAPAWENGPLLRTDRDRVSACLLAHVNAFGVSVPISVRSDDSPPTTTAEKTAYPVYEATFFGAIFDGAYAPYACLGTDAATASAESDYRSVRVCADAVNGSTTSACTFQALGPCAAVCDVWVAGEGWQSCWSGGAHGVGTRYVDTISTWLLHN